MNARDLMTSPAITCNANDTLDVAAHLMWVYDCGAVVVVREEDGSVAGMITDRDICMAAFTQGRPPNEIVVSTAMGRPVTAVRGDAMLRIVEELMAAHQIRRIPVVDAGNRPIGVISLNDLAREACAPRSRIKNGHARIAGTLASICERRIGSRAA